MSENTDLIVGIHDLPRRPGTMKQLAREVDAPADLGVEMIRVPAGSPVQLELTLESAGEGVLVRGTAEAQLEGECVRCLGPIAYSDTFDVEELYFYAGRDAEEDSNFIEDDEIDLEPALREGIVLNLPINPICKPECLGLCQVCGFDLNEDPAHAHEATTDGRWAALRGLDLA
ncbi:MAG: DUF177 domain-containing protein [Propionibacteriaceae bacterium]|jgi:uncharacterized protein|nr:DUF177 domain-containing protein [Propionibacteriaceae bacterium]